jgi:hypothetical protein
MIQVLHQVVNYKQQLHYHLIYNLQHKVHIVILHIHIVYKILVNVYQKINFVILTLNVMIKRMNSHAHKYALLNNKHYVYGHMIVNKNFFGILVMEKQHHLVQVQALVNHFLFNQQIKIENMYSFFQIIQPIVSMEHISIWKQVQE